METELTAIPGVSPAIFAEAVLGLRLYPWQAEAVEAVGMRRWTALVAANGSGKTACVNVVLLLWFLYMYPRGIAMVTSGSWRQLKTQLWPNLEMHRALFPQWDWGAERIRTPQGGFIAAYSTTDPGKAEGHHEHLPERPVMLMVDEAKSVPESIFQALSRCTPTYYVLTSSPGAPSGTFYRAFRTERSLYHTVRATAFACPHIKADKIERARVLYGPNYDEHPVYRSMILAEFAEGEEGVIIPRRLIEQALEHKPERREGEKYAGVDWAAGGDETTLAIRDGNAVRLVWHARVKDTVAAAESVVGRLRAYGVQEGMAWGDACGIGLGIIQAAGAMHGYRMRLFDGGQPADDNKHFANLNIEAWHYFRQSLERGEVCFADGLDEETITQLSDRYLSWKADGRLRCESKDDMKARGVHSPDRADAIVMAWWAGRHMLYRGEDGTLPPRFRIPAQKGRFRVTW